MSSWLRDCIPYILDETHDDIWFVQYEVKCLFFTMVFICEFVLSLLRLIGPVMI